ncbi:hypothetical protein ACTFJW_08945 [Clostridium cagae]|uniref:hypothetical protein n=1 Tax=Clostridium cagae TaxID=2080751 RepID=UPI003F776813
MEGDLGAGARIAVALIILGVLISVAFIILGFVRGTTQTGISSVQNSMDKMTLSRFEDYDQKVLSGTQVKSTVKLFEGDAIGLCVQTTRSGTTAFNYGALLEGFTADTSAKVYKKTMSGTDTGSCYNMNYASDNIQYNLVSAPLNETGKDPFVRGTAKFMAKLVKDNTGTIVGIFFKQMS